eukprot:scaffold48164_cov68-Phaeocystis_antarctica.AAC.2
MLMVPAPVSLAARVGEAARLHLRRRDVLERAVARAAAAHWRGDVLDAAGHTRRAAAAAVVVDVAAVGRQAGIATWRKGRPRRQPRARARAASRQNSASSRLKSMCQARRAVTPPINHPPFGTLATPARSISPIREGTLTNPNLRSLDFLAHRDARRALVLPPQLRGVAAVST